MHDVIPLLCESCEKADVQVCITSTTDPTPFWVCIDCASVATEGAELRREVLAL